MAIDTANSVSGTSTQAKAATLSSATAAEQSDRFMKLLVAQMKNQDPLNPMDNAQMTSQIAQINTVGGIEKLNRTVEGLLSAFQGLQTQAATQLPGKSVLIAGNKLALGEGEATAGVELASRADEVNVDIVGTGGKVVRSIALGAREAGVHSFTWDGLEADCSAAPQRNYLLRTAALAAGKPVEAATLTSARVQAVTQGASGVQLDLGAAGLRAYGDAKSFF